MPTVPSGDLSATVPSSAAELSARVDLGLDATASAASDLTSDGAGVSEGVDMPGPLPAAGDGLSQSFAGELLVTTNLCVAVP